MGERFVIYKVLIKNEEGLMNAIGGVGNLGYVPRAQESMEETEIFSRMEIEDAQTILRENETWPCYLLRESRTEGQISLSMLVIKGDRDLRFVHHRLAFNGEKWVFNNAQEVQNVRSFDLDTIRREKANLLQAIEPILKKEEVPLESIIRPTPAQRTKNALYAAYGNLRDAQKEEERENALTKAKKLLERYGEDAITWEKIEEEKAVILPSGHLVARDTLRARREAAGRETYEDPFTRKPLSSRKATHCESTILSRLRRRVEEAEKKR